MRFGKSTWYGVVLVLIGLLFLIKQLPIGHSLWLQASHLVWPIVWIGIGFLSLGGSSKHRFSWTSAFFIVFGFVYLVRNMGFAPLQSIGSGTLFWSMAIIFAGLSMILQPGSHRISVKVKLRDKKNSVWGNNPDDDLFGKSYGVSYKSGGKWSHLMGETVVGNQPWTMPRRAAVFTGMGESRVNLVTAHLEEGEYTLDVSGWMGQIRVLVPKDLAVTVNASMQMGQVDVFGDTHSGLVRDVMFQDPDFNTATTRLVIFAHLPLGQIDIVRV